MFVEAITSSPSPVKFTYLIVFFLFNLDNRYSQFLLNRHLPLKFSKFRSDGKVDAKCWGYSNEYDTAQTPRDHI